MLGAARRTTGTSVARSIAGRLLSIPSLRRLSLDPGLDTAVLGRRIGRPS